MKNTTISIKKFQVLTLMVSKLNPKLKDKISVTTGFEKFKVLNVIGLKPIHLTYFCYSKDFCVSNKNLQIYLVFKL